VVRPCVDLGRGVRAAPPCFVDRLPKAPVVFPGCPSSCVAVSACLAGWFEKLDFSVEVRAAENRDDDSLPPTWVAVQRRVTWVAVRFGARRSSWSRAIS